jgi:hypothetical protein
MQSVSRNEIGAIRMLTNPPEHLVNAGHRVIHKSGFIWFWDDTLIKWQQGRKATRKDYLDIPQLI